MVVPSCVCVAFLTLQKGWTPLMEAARGGFKDIVEELAKRGADLNMRTVRTNQQLQMLIINSETQSLQYCVSTGSW